MKLPFPILFALAFFVSGCRPVIDAPPTAPALPVQGWPGSNVTVLADGTSNATQSTQVAPEKGTLPPKINYLSGTLSAPQAFRVTLNEIFIEGVKFSETTHYLAVADQPKGPGSLWADAQSCGKAHRADAAINAGFFTPEGAPLGLVITPDSHNRAVNQASSLGTGIFYEGSDRRPQIIRRNSAALNQALAARYALQSGPFLLENSAPPAGLSTQTSTARSFLATDGRGNWVLARSGACSLAELATALAQNPLSGLKLKTALNLDGGRSSELWVSNTISGGPLQTRPLWNRPVRNFLLLVKR